MAVVSMVLFCHEIKDITFSSPATTADLADLCNFDRALPVLSNLAEFRPEQHNPERE